MSATPQRVEVQMDRPLPPDWGGELTDDGSHLYYSAWDSDDEEVRVWVGPYEGKVAEGWAVIVGAPGVDVTLRANPDRILEWVDEIKAAIEQSREEARWVAEENARSRR